jgi:hypothetical protein
MVWREFRVSVGNHCQHFGDCLGLANPARRMDHCFAWLFQYLRPSTNASFPRRSGMMVAVPAWRLAELLDAEIVQNVKRKKEADAKKASDEVNLDFEPFY